MFVGFVVLCLLGGGASRPDVASLLYLRPAAVMCIAVLMVFAAGVDFRPFRTPLILLGGLAALMLAQLVPLPPALWSALPGHQQYLAGVEAVGGAEAWRPLSLTPDLTINGLITLLFPLAGLIGFASLRRDQRAWLLPALILAACLSALLGIVQATSRPGSVAFLYRITHEGMSVGLFSNRNHQAVLLALSFPMLRVWTLMPTPDPNYRRARSWIALCIGLLFIPLIMVTGSRAGLALGVVGLLSAYALSPRLPRFGAMGSAAALRKPLLLAVPVVIAGAVYLLGRAEAIQRLLAFENLQTEPRVVFAPVTFEMARDFFPVGTGFGAFDRVFRGYEPDGTLDFAYFNHAHNDLIELVIDGGLPALLLLLLLVGWWARRMLGLLRAKSGSSRHLLAKLGGIMMLMLFLSSLVEYPLRVPLMIVVFAIACGWLAQATPDAERLAR